MKIEKINSHTSTKGLTFGAKGGNYSSDLANPLDNVHFCSFQLWAVHSQQFMGLI